jgi:hypothetical protein
MHLYGWADFRNAAYHGSGYDLEAVISGFYTLLSARTFYDDTIFIEVQKSFYVHTQTIFKGISIMQNISSASDFQTYPLTQVLLNKISLLHSNLHRPTPWIYDSNHMPTRSSGNN